MNVRELFHLHPGLMFGLEIPNALCVLCSNLCIVTERLKVLGPRTQERGSLELETLLRVLAVGRLLPDHRGDVKQSRNECGRGLTSGEGQRRLPGTC